MRIRRLHTIVQGALAVCFLASTPWMASAQTIPGPADASRIQMPPRVFPDSLPDTSPSVPGTALSTPIPKGADKVRFTLKELRIVGATAFTPEELTHHYAQHIGQTISLETVYRIAGEITQRYRDAGYFLSLAYVPDQHVDDGIVTLQVLEGYVGAVDVPESMQGRIVTAQLDWLRAQKPLSAQALESVLLRLNDLPGNHVTGTLSSLDGAKDGAVKLTLETQKSSGKGQIGFDNASSRFLGPNEASFSYSKSLLPFQETTVTGLTSLPMDELNYVALGHTAAIAPDITLELAGGFTDAQPGFTLAPLDIESESMFLSIGARYQWIRQRDENLSLKFSIDSRDTSSDLLNTPFTRDRIRALRLNASYDTADHWDGYNFASMTLSQGIDGLGASRKGSANLSRAEATPDFTKLELSLTRLQRISNEWSVLVAATAQAASGPLFSAEEFGYGGQNFGRAFDASEISGDHGAAGSVELRYSGWDAADIAHFSPYAFYDGGIVWNDDTAQDTRQSGTSIGAGVRAATAAGVNGNLGLAWPLTRDAANPIYGQSQHGPRIMLQVSKDF